MRAHVHIGHVEYNVMSPSAFGVMCHPPLSTRVPNQVPKPSESSVVWISSYLRHFQRRGDGFARVCWRCRRLRLQKEKARELACLSPTWHSTFLAPHAPLVHQNISSAGGRGQHNTRKSLWTLKRSRNIYCGNWRFGGNWWPLSDFNLQSGVK